MGQGRHGETILDLRKELAVARRCGYVFARGEVDFGLVGIAAPVSSSEQAIAASLSVIVPGAGLSEIVKHRLVLLVTTSAKLMADRLNRADGPSALRRPATAGRAM